MAGLIQAAAMVEAWPKEVVMEVPQIGTTRKAHSIIILTYSYSNSWCRCQAAPNDQLKQWAAAVRASSEKQPTAKTSSYKHLSMFSFNPFNSQGNESKKISCLSHRVQREWLRFLNLSLRWLLNSYKFSFLIGEIFFWLLLKLSINIKALCYLHITTLPLS